MILCCCPLYTPARRSARSWRVGTSENRAAAVFYLQYVVLCVVQKYSSIDILIGVLRFHAVSTVPHCCCCTPRTDSRFPLHDVQYSRSARQGRYCRSKPTIIALVTAMQMLRLITYDVILSMSMRRVRSEVVGGYETSTSSCRSNTLHELH